MPAEPDVLVLGLVSEAAKSVARPMQFCITRGVAPTGQSSPAHAVPWIRQSAAWAAATPAADTCTDLSQSHGELSQNYSGVVSWHPHSSLKPALCFPEPLAVQP